MAGFVMESGLYANVHMQKIALSLLGGAAVSCLCAIYTYQLNFKTQMTQAALAFNVNVGFFMWCRWYLFPIESLALVQDVRADEELSGSVVFKLLIAGGVLMSLFNVGILVDIIPKTVRYIKRAFDGVTPIETEAVPSSRDSIMMGRGRGRRSSVMMALNTVNPVSGRNSRSSISTIMGLNAIENLLHTEKGASEKKEAEIEGLSKEEMKALNKTLSGVSDSKKSK